MISLFDDLNKLLIINKMTHISTNLSFYSIRLIYSLSPLGHIIWSFYGYVQLKAIKYILYDLNIPRNGMVEKQSFGMPPTYRGAKYDLNNLGQHALPR